MTHEGRERYSVCPFPPELPYPPGATWKAVALAQSKREQLDLQVDELTIGQVQVGMEEAVATNPKSMLLGQP
jgi:hypothetical protein